MGIGHMSPGTYRSQRGTVGLQVPTEAVGQWLYECPCLQTPLGGGHLSAGARRSQMVVVGM